MTESKNRPVREFRCGGVRAAIWQTLIPGNAQNGVRHSIGIEKRYRDKKTDQWQSTHHFFPEDLPDLVLVAQKAFEFTRLKEIDKNGG